MILPQVKWFLTVALAALASATALGQLTLDMTPFLEDGLGASVLLRNKGVQKEIHMTDEQKDKINKIVHDVFVKCLSDAQKVRTDGDPKNKLQVILDSGPKIILESEDKVNKAIPDILTEVQIKRLKQIQLQVNVLQSLNKPDIQRKLRLTNEQKTEIKKIADGFKKDIGKVLKSVIVDTPRVRRESGRKATEMAQTTMKLKDEANRKAMKTFTEEQNKTWNDMTGEKFEFKPDRPNLPGARP